MPSWRRETSFSVVRCGNVRIAWISNHIFEFRYGTFPITDTDDPVVISLEEGVELVWHAFEM